MPPAIERTIYTEEEEFLSNGEILNEPPPPYSEYPLVTNSIVQNRHQAVNSSNNYGQQIVPHNSRSQPPNHNDLSRSSFSTASFLSTMRITPQLSSYHNANMHAPLVYSPPQPLSSSTAVPNNNPFFQIFNSTISQPLSSTSSSLSLSRMSGRHGARMNFLQGGDITTSRFQQELDDDDSCCFAPCELKTWGCLIYLIFFSLPFGFFCFSWVIVTSIVCLVSLLNPPLAYIIFLITAASYRMLGRIELVTQSFFGGQPKFYHENRYYQIYYPPVFCLDNSIIINSISSSSSTTNNNYSFYSLVSNFLKSTLNYIADEYTWRCLIYFLIFKISLSILTFIISVISITFSLPFALCFFCPSMYLVKNIGTWQKEVAFEFLVY